MDSSTSTGHPEPALEPPSTAVPLPDATAVPLPAATAVPLPDATTVPLPDVHPSLAVSMREQCSACGAAMACDQRYCVECGERRGPARVPALTERAPSAREAPSASPSPRRARVPLNSTLLAGIGTLLLAMGVGVLIGRSGASTSAKPPPAQVVTIAGGAGAAGTSTAPSTSPAGTATTAKPGGATGAAGAAGAGGGKSASQTHAKAPPKAVKVGSPGKGAGYQHGHFTGNFFGPESG